MQVKQLAALVAEMRKAQRKYFETRSHDVLIESKRLESEVDWACNEILDYQGKLFDTGHGEPGQGSRQG